MHIKHALIFLASVYLLFTKLFTYLQVYSTMQKNGMFPFCPLYSRRNSVMYFNKLDCKLTEKNDILGLKEAE